MWHRSLFLDHNRSRLDRYPVPLDLLYPPQLLLDLAAGSSAGSSCPLPFRPVCGADQEVFVERKAGVALHDKGGIDVGVGVSRVAWADRMTVKTKAKRHEFILNVATGRVVNYRSLAYTGTTKLCIASFPGINNLHHLLACPKPLMMSVFSANFIPRCL